MQPEQTAIAQESLISIGSFISKVYLWMTGGLALTAIISWAIVTNPAWLGFILLNPAIVPVLFLLELGLVLGLSFFINKLSMFAAAVMFVLYAAINGVFFGAVIFGYTQASVFTAFAATAGTFLLMALYGMFTKADLTRVGSLAQMALLGLVLGLIINLFVANDTLSQVLTFVGIFIFIILIAYDTQKLKQMAAQAELSADGNKYAVLGALTLYLDFINLFIRLLQIFGKRR